jgi:hypothetical protein
VRAIGLAQEIQKIVRVDVYFQQMARRQARLLEEPLTIEQAHRDDRFHVARGIVVSPCIKECARDRVVDVDGFVIAADANRILGGRDVPRLASHPGRSVPMRARG